MRFAVVGIVVLSLAVIGLARRWFWVKHNADGMVGTDEKGLPRRG